MKTMRRSETMKKLSAGEEKKKTEVASERANEKKKCQQQQQQPSLLKQNMAKSVCKIANWPNRKWLYTNRDDESEGKNCNKSNVLPLQ